MNIQFGSEADLEAAIVEEISKTGRCPVDDEEVDDLFQQIEIPGYGRCDLVKVAHDPHETRVTVLELKNKPLTLDDLNQVCRYMTGIRRALHRFSVLSNYVSVEGQLAGPVNVSGDIYAFQECGISVFGMDIGFKSGIQFSYIDGWRNTREKPTRLNRTIMGAIKRGRVTRSKFNQAMRGMEDEQ